MKRWQWLMSLVLLWSAACAGATSPTPTSAPGVSATVTPALSEAFTPSDPKTVQLAAGRPQLVEFYAVW